jgi:hypothetical protein
MVTAAAASLCESAPFANNQVSCIWYTRLDIGRHVFDGFKKGLCCFCLYHLWQQP